MFTRSEADWKLGGAFWKEKVYIGELQDKICNVILDDMQSVSYKEIQQLIKKKSKSMDEQLNLLPEHGPHILNLNFLYKFVVTTMTLF